MRKAYIVSFDFDGVLTEQRFQNLAKEVLNKGFEVIILTSRSHFAGLKSEVGYNADVYKVASEIGIAERNIIFTSCQGKENFIIPDRIIMHIDDSDMDLYDIKSSDKRFNTIKHSAFSNQEILEMLPVIFDEENIKKLNESQKNGMFHPYTCSGNGKCDVITSISRNLKATQAGWVCECGEYRQFWSH